METAFKGETPDVGTTDFEIIIKLSAQLDEIEKVSLHRFYCKTCVGSQFSAIFWPSRINTLISGTVRVTVTWNSAKHLLSRQTIKP